MQPTFLRAETAPGQQSEQLGWIGGNPRTPDAFVWPSRNGIPHQFVCQINCAGLPKGTWNDLGPKNGWLLVFLSNETDVSAEVIYLNADSEMRPNPNGVWFKERSSLAGFSANYDRFIMPPVSWPLYVLEENDASVALPKALGDRPDDDRTIDLRSDPRFVPRSWVELDLLIENSLEAVKASSKPFQGQIDEDDERVEFKNELMSEIDRQLEALEKIRKKHQRLNEYGEFSFLRWLNDPEVLDYLVNSHGPKAQLVLTFAGLKDIHSIKSFSRAATSDLPDSAALDVGRFCDLVEKTKIHFLQHPDLPRQYDLRTWTDFKASNISTWEKYDRLLKKMKRAYFVLGARYHVPLSKLKFPPYCLRAYSFDREADTWNSLNAAIQAEMRWLLNRRETAAFGSEETRRARDRIAVLKARKRYIDDHQRGFAEQDKASNFEVSDWMAFLNELSGFDKGKPSAPSHQNYRYLRTLTAEQSDERQGFSAQYLDYLNRQWSYRAECSTLQLGGNPRAHAPGFMLKNATFAPYVKVDSKKVMLLQIPSSSLTHLSFGDVDDLVISITRWSLKRKRFDKITVEVSN